MNNHAAWYYERTKRSMGAESPKWSNDFDKGVNGIHCGKWKPSQHILLDKVYIYMGEKNLSLDSYFKPDAQIILLNWVWIQPTCKSQTIKFI